MFYYKSAIINQHNSPCPIRQRYHLYTHCTRVLFVLVSHQSHYGGSIIPQVGTTQQARQNLPHQAQIGTPQQDTQNLPHQGQIGTPQQDMQNRPQQATRMPSPSNPTCPECGRPFKTYKGLLINGNHCLKKADANKAETEAVPKRSAKQMRGGC